MRSREERTPLLSNFFGGLNPQYIGEFNNHFEITCLGNISFTLEKTKYL